MVRYASINEYEIEFMFRKIRNIRNLGNVHIRGPHIVMSRTDAQNGIDFHFKKYQQNCIKDTGLGGCKIENSMGNDLKFKFASMK